MTTNPTPRRTGRAGGALLCLIASAPLALTAFIALPDYGTRACSVVRFEKDSIQFLEQGFHAQSGEGGDPQRVGEEVLEFREAGGIVVVP